MRPAFRAMAAVLAAASLLSIAACKKPVVHGILEVEANEILVILNLNGITAELARSAEESKEGVLFDIMVDETDYMNAVATLNENQLPKKKEKGFAEIFGSSGGLMETEQEKTAKHIAALMGTLTNTLRSISNVVDAKVTLVLPEANPFASNQDVTPARAAVLLKVKQKDVPKVDPATSPEGPTVAIEKEGGKPKEYTYRDLLIAISTEYRSLLDSIRDLQAKLAEEARYLGQATAKLPREGEEYNKFKDLLDKLDKASRDRQVVASKIGDFPRFAKAEAVANGLDTVESQALPLTIESVKDIVAKSVPRLDPKNVKVEIDPVYETPRQAKAPPAGMDKNRIIIIAVGALAVIGGALAFWLGLSLSKAKKQVAELKAAQAAQAAGLMGSSVGT